MPGNFIMNYNDDATGIRGARLDNIVEYTHEWVDLVLDHVPLDHYVLEVATPDVVNFRSNVAELIGSRQLENPELFDPEESSLTKLHGCRIYARLVERGTDIIEVMAQRVHEHGAQFFAEVRMNDTHHRRIDPSEIGCAQFAIDHPEWAIKRTDKLPEGIEETALDYSYPQVRAHRLAIIEELANRPEVDGVELNCNRWLKFFQRELAPQKAPILTDFLGEVHQAMTRAAEKRGRERLSLGARVGSTIEECAWAGMDVRQWIERGYVDYLIVADWNWCNPQLRIEEFAELTRGTGCKLLVQMGDGPGGVWNGKPTVKDRDRGPAILGGSDGYHALRNTDAEARACANNIYAWGGEGIGFWNICDHMGNAQHKTPKNPSIDMAYRNRMVHWMQQVVDPETVRAGPRHYHYCPLWKYPRMLRRLHPHREQYHSPGGGKHCQIVTFDNGCTGDRRVYQFRMADGRDGEPLTGYVRFQIFHITPVDELTIDVNGSAVEADKITRDHRPTADPPTTWFEIDLANCPPLRGDNELGITIVKMTDKPEPPYLEELEVFVTP